MMNKSPASGFRLDAMRGAGLLVFDAIEGVSNIVEAMHSNIAAAPMPIGRGTDGRARGLSGLAYSSTRLVNRLARTLVDGGLSLIARPFEAQLREQPAELGPVIPALNGVLGDRLASSGNPLAIEMQMRLGGRPLNLDRDALSKAIPEANGRILVVLHGLCMSDLQMSRSDHDHGARLARDENYTPVYLNYNSGRHTSENGRDLARMMKALIENWPTPVTEVNFLAHSMGGLVARSACHYGAEARHGWLASLRRMVFLGTPHHGAPLERSGNRVLSALGLSPYTAPLARLGWLRSAGLTDLRFGNLIDEDWQNIDRFEHARDSRHSVEIPKGVACYAIAATVGSARGDLKDRMLGDGLVPVSSALGQHRDGLRALDIPESRKWVRHGIHHMDLLSDGEVYDRLRVWFG